MGLEQPCVTSIIKSNPCSYFQTKITIMSINTFLKVGLGTLLGGPILETLVEKASDKAVSIFQEKFTFTAFEMAETYQESYGYALAVITVGLADPEEKFQFLKTLSQSKVEREFSAQIEQDYLQPRECLLVKVDAIQTTQDCFTKLALLPSK